MFIFCLGVHYSVFCFCFCRIISFILINLLINYFHFHVVCVLQNVVHLTAEAAPYEYEAVPLGTRTSLQSHIPPPDRSDQMQLWQQWTGRSWSWNWMNTSVHYWSWVMRTIFQQKLVSEIFSFLFVPVSPCKVICLIKKIFLFSSLVF